MIFRTFSYPDTVSEPVVFLFFASLTFFVHQLKLCSIEYYKHINDLNTYLETKVYVYAAEYIFFKLKSSLTDQSFSRIVPKCGSRDGHVNWADEKIRIMNVEQIFKMSVWKPNGEEVFIIEEEGIIKRVDFTRTSVVDVWNEVINAENVLRINWKVSTKVTLSLLPDIVHPDTKYSIGNLFK